MLSLCLTPAKHTEALANEIKKTNGVDLFLHPAISCSESLDNRYNCLKANVAAKVSNLVHNMIGTFVSGFLNFL